MPESPLETYGSVSSRGTSNHFETRRWNKTRRGQIRHFITDKKQGGHSFKAALIEISMFC